MGCMQSTEPLQRSEPTPLMGASQPLQSDNANDPYVTVKHAAMVFETSREVVYRRFRAGQIPGRKIGSNYRILRSFVESFDRAARSGAVDFDEFSSAWFRNVSAGAA